MRFEIIQGGLAGPETEPDSGRARPGAGLAAARRAAGRLRAAARRRAWAAPADPFAPRQCAVRPPQTPAPSTAPSSPAASPAAAATGAAATGAGPLAAAAVPVSSLAAVFPAACPDGHRLAPGLAIHHDGDPRAVRLISADARGWVVEIGEPEASYVSFAFSADPARAAPGPGRILRGLAALSAEALSLPGLAARPGAGAPLRGWMRVNASDGAGGPVRSSLRDVGFERERIGRAFSWDALGVGAEDPAPGALWLDLILAAPRGRRIALRSMALESRMAPRL